MSKNIIPLRELPLSNDFMFGAVMRREKICKLFLEALLQKEIKKVQFVDKQKDLTDSYESHGIRLDIYLNDENGTIYNIEMQTVNRDDLLRRARFYQSAIDRNALEKNDNYRKLTDTYVVFVCAFDYFQRGFAIYEEEKCVKSCPDLKLDDGAHLLILNSKYTEGNADPAILEFLSFIRDNNLHASFHSELMTNVTTAVKEVRSDEKMEVKYMTLATKLADAHRDGWVKGHDEGVAEGRAKEQETIIRSLLAFYSPAEISKTTGISLETVEAIKKKNSTEH